jgi:hypothetical protein
MEGLFLIDDFGSKAGKTDVLGSSAYFVNKRSQKFCWNNVFKYNWLNFDQSSIK